MRGGAMSEGVGGVTHMGGVISEAVVGGGVT